MRRQRSHTKPKRLGDLERLSIGRLRRLKDLTVQKITPLEAETSKFRTIVNDETKLAGQMREEQRRISEENRRIDEQVDRLRNDPLSRRSGLLRIFKGQYTDSAMVSIAELQRQRRWKNSVIPVNYYTVEAYGLRGPAADILAYLEQELGILRSELDKINRILERKVTKESRETERHARAVATNKKHTATVAELRAQAAAALGKTRQRGSVVRRRLPSNHPCPYCGGSLGADYHTDHIYPVSKGGQSSLRNMVNVCRTCNTRKGTMTLATFIRDYSLNQQEIERRLLALNKDF